MTGKQIGVTSEDIGLVGLTLLQSGMPVLAVTIAMDALYIASVADERPGPLDGTQSAATGFAARFYDLFNEVGRDNLDLDTDVVRRAFAALIGVRLVRVSRGAAGDLGHALKVISGSKGDLAVTTGKASALAVKAG